MRIINKMKKTMFVLAASLFCTNVAFADTQTVYSWESPDGTPIETGGTIVHASGDGKRVNYSNAGYFTVCLNGKYGNMNDGDGAKNSDHIVLTLDEALQTGDVISITAYRNKNADGKSSSIYFLFESGAEWKDSNVFTNICADETNADWDNDGDTPNTVTWTITDSEAGSKTIKMSRNSAGTNLFITKLAITREVAATTEKVYATFEAPTNTNAIWNAETNSFTWTQSYYNQIRNIGLPTGDITKYAKLVIDCEIISGTQFRILFYKGSDNKQLYINQSGVTEINIVEELSKLGDDYLSYLQECTEICLSGAGNTGEVKINSVYLETAPATIGFDLTAYNQAVADAEALKAQLDPTDWMQEELIVAIDEAIAFAKEGVDAAASQEDVDISANMLAETVAGYKVNVEKQKLMAEAQRVQMIADSVYNSYSEAARTDNAGLLNAMMALPSMRFWGTYDEGMALCKACEDAIAAFQKENKVEATEVDVTSKWIVNPTVNDSKDGWTSETNAQNKALATNKVAESNGVFTGKFLENWLGNPITGEIYQEVANLPAGSYRFEMGAFAELQPNAGVAYVFANDASVEVNTATPSLYKLDITIAEGESLKIGLKVDGGANWVGLDNAKLIHITTTTLGQEINALNAVLDSVNALKASYAEVVEAEALDAVVAAVKNGSIDECKASVKTLYAAMDAFKVVNDAKVAWNELAASMKGASAANPVNVTGFIANAGFEGSSYGCDNGSGGGNLTAPESWTVTYTANVDWGWKNFQSIGGEVQEGTKGFEFWAGTYHTLDLAQEILLPAGTYMLSAALRTERADQITSQHVYVKIGEDVDSSAVLGAPVGDYWNAKNAWQTLSVSFSLDAESKVVVGAGSTGGAGSAGWFQIDNFQLACLSNMGAEMTAAVDSLSKLIAEAEAWKAELNPEDEMHAQVIPMLEQMIPAAQAVVDAPASLEAVNAMIFDVYVALGSYKPMVDQYDAKMAASAALEEAKALLATYSKYTDKAGFEVAIANVENMMVDINMGMATIADLNAAVEAMKVAQEAFVAENAKSDMAVVKSWDFAAIADTMTVSDMYMTYSEETVKVGGTASNLGTGIWEGLAMQGANKYFIRSKTGGLYQGNGGGRKVGILDLVPGQKVTIVTSGECFTLNSTDIAEQTSVETVDGKTTYVYTMTGEGILALTMTRYFNIFSITVEQTAAMVQTALWDFAAIADTMAVSDMYMTYSDETVKVGGTASNLGTGVWAGLAMQGANKFFIRTKTGGLYQGNGGGRKVGVLDLKKGSVVSIVTSGECFTLADATVAEQTSMETVDGKTTYVYTMTEDGTLALTMTRYFNIFSIKVESLVKYITSPNWDFAAYADTMSVSDSYMTYSAETVKVGGTASNLGTGFWEGLAMQGANKFWVRSATGGLYSGNGGGRKVGVLNMTEGSVITVVTNGECMTLADATVAEQTSMETVDGKTTYVYTMTADGTLALTMTRYFTIYSINVLAVQPDIKAPTIETAGNYYDVVIVSMACETKNASIYYTFNGGEEILYTEPFQIEESGLISAYSTDGKAVSKPTEKEVAAAAVDVPVATVAAVQGTNRVIELTCALEGTELYYTTDTLAAPAEYYVYTAPFHISDTTNVWAYALKASEVKDTIFASQMLKAEMAAGEELVLSAPTFAKAAVDSLTNIEYAAKNLADYVILTDQSAVLGAPADTITFDFFPLIAETGRVAAVPSVSGAIAAGDTVKALPLGKLVARASSYGYKTAEAYTWLKAPAQLTAVWEIDFDSLATVHASAGDLAPTMTDVVFNGKFRSNATSDFSNVAVNGEALNAGFVLQTGTNWLLRTAADSYGLYNYNSGDRAFGFAGLKKNQVVKISYQDATAAIFMDGVIETDLGNTNGNDVCYNVTADGNATIGMNRYYTLHKVGVYISSALTQTPDFAVTKVDGTTHYVSMTSGTKGADIYYAIGHEEYTESQVLVNDTIGGVDPIYETKIDTTVVYGGVQLYTKPVGLDKTSYVRAYAMYQDVESEAREQLIEAGFAVQLAQPVIVYTGDNEAGEKTFTISVDNSEVISAPVADIYYTMPNGAETLYNGGAVSVKDTDFGWMTAVAKLAGYDDSKAARRYIDARESYTEKYEVVDATLETMPAEAGDVEIDYAEDMNIEQLGATAYAGRVYFHRVVEADLINVSLPSVFNQNCYVTDAAGNKLERNVDYAIYEINANERPIQEVLTGNMAATAAKGYVVYFMNADLLGKEVIFVSAVKGNIAKANFTYAQPEAGYKVVTNRSFTAATLEVPAYVLNADGTAFDLVETGAVVAPFQSVILASADICATVASLNATPAGDDVDVTGIDELAGKDVKEIKYFTVGGVEVEKPAAGVYIQQITFTDGTVKTISVAGK